MKFFLDTEFIESGAGKPITLLSIALVDEAGQSFYAVNADANHDEAGPWVRENVLPRLGDTKPMNLESIAYHIKAFIGDEDPVFIGYYADYDWVVFCQIFGSMSALPQGWPMYCVDLKQRCDDLGNPRLPTIGKGEHNALADAYWNREAWLFLDKYEMENAS